MPRRQVCRFFDLIFVFYPREAAMFNRGNRLFATGSIMLLLVAALHTFGHFAGAPEDEALASVANAMRAYTFDLGLGMRPSLMDVQESLSLTMSIFLIFLGMQNLTTLALAPQARRLVRALALINFLCAAALASLYAVYRILPPFASFMAVTLVFLPAWLLSRRENQSGAQD